MPKHTYRSRFSFAAAYPYMHHLWALEGARPPVGYNPPAQFQWVSGLFTPHRFPAGLGE